MYILVLHVYLESRISSIIFTKGVYQPMFPRLIIQVTEALPRNPVFQCGFKQGRK